MHQFAPNGASANLVLRSDDLMINPSRSKISRF
jgi:hypothetical protein